MTDDTVQWRHIVNTVTQVHVSQSAGNFLIT